MYYICSLYTTYYYICIAYLQRDPGPNSSVCMWRGAVVGFIKPTEKSQMTAVS